MTAWKTKAQLQRTLSRLPWRHQIYHWLRRHVLKTLDAGPEAHQKRLEWAGKHIQYYQKNTEAEQLPPLILELGTGEFVTVPIALFLCGAARVVSIDIEQLFRRTYFLAMLQSLAQYPANELADLLPLFQPERFEILQNLAEKADHLSIEAILATLQIETRIMDAQKTSYPENQFDLILSNTTLEHIPPKTLEKILEEFHRILKPGGWMSHLVDMSDHYEHSDHAISPYNYLQYDAASWQKFNSPFLYQTRLRAPDYLSMLKAVGFEPIETWTYAAQPEALNRIALAPEFLHYKSDQLAITHLWSITRKVK